MKRVVFFIVLICPIFLIHAQSVDDYFHSAAKYYINGDKSKAKEAIEEAVKKFPNDANIRRLAEKIKKLPDDKKDNQQKNNNQQQNQQSQQNRQTKDNKDQQKDQNQQQDNYDKNRQDDQKQQKSQKPQMSKENAQQILDALQQDEKNAQEKARKLKVRGQKKAEKDW
ncbi:MAG TPA: hypothetical protein VK152_07680 [Paludibacter sp.]|nr:hypothetical protein [Paludibacter sp.]